MNKTIGIIGAGRSATNLIEYLIQYCKTTSNRILIAESNIELAKSKIKGHESVSDCIQFDVTNVTQRIQFISKVDIVVSMLPAHMHIAVAQDCIGQNKHFLSASYVSPQMAELHNSAVENNVLLLNELGVDPGIDHMSAMRVIHEIQELGGKMLGFESFTGGLVAPESDDNPWNYKISWNPRNVVIAGQGGAAKFIQEGKYKYIPYQKLFRRTEIVEIEGYGRFEGYANRDSLRYRDIYGLNDIPTIYRGTFRRPGFCRAWDVFVQLGCTDDTYSMEGTEEMTYREYLNSFLAYDEFNTIELKLRYYMHIDQDSEIWEKFEWLDIFSSKKKIGIPNATPAQCLEKILSEKWVLSENDKDMVVMWHKFDFELEGKKHKWESSMVAIGDDSVHTAMSKTVGLPLAIATTLVMEGIIELRGVVIPIEAEVYNPILDKLEDLGIHFKEKRDN